MTLEYGKDIGAVPLHLDFKFFDETLENGLRRQNFKIKNIRLTMGSSNGENYCSQIYRVIIEYSIDKKSDKFSVIIKSVPLVSGTEFLEDLEVFLKEKIFYSNVLPIMDAFIGHGHTFGARLLNSLKYPVNTLVFEDLNAKGFQLASRESGLDEEHCRLVVEKLGQFHGISMILNKKNPDIMKFFNNGMLAKVGLERDNSLLLKYFCENLTALIELISSWKDFAKITEKIKKYRLKLKENLCRSQAPIDDEIKVLNHGDLWVNNILFKYEHHNSRTLHDAVFVDYQMSIWGSPGIDLNYFFYTSLRLDILKTKLELLITEYHKSLESTLHQMHYANIPSLHDIKKEVKRRALYGFFANYGIFPTVTMEKDQCTDNKLENFVDEEFTRNKVRKMFSSKRIEETLKYTLRMFDEMKIFDLDDN